MSQSSNCWPGWIPAFAGMTSVWRKYRVRILSVGYDRPSCQNILVCRHLPACSEFADDDEECPFGHGVRPSFFLRRNREFITMYVRSMCACAVSARASDGLIDRFACSIFFPVRSGAIKGHCSTDLGRPQVFSSRCPLQQLQQATDTCYF